MSSSARVLQKTLKVNFEVLKGETSARQFFFDKSSITVGRGPENDIVFAVDSKMSRQHIEFYVTGQGVSVKNLSQKNSISVDGEVVLEKKLSSGCLIRLGDTELRVLFDVSAQNSTAEQKNQLIAPGLPPIPGSTVPTQGPQSTSVMASKSSGSSVSTFQHQMPQPSRSTLGGSVMTGSSSRSKLYVIVVVVALGLYWLFQGQTKKKKIIQLRDSASIESAISQSQNSIEKTQTEIEKKGYETTQYKLAQEQYLRGFRDYRQGQYVRAMEAFQAALSFFPTHELARKYYILSKRKFDEQIQFHMIQGKRYYGLQNYRLCMAHYSNVIKMKKDDRDPVRREALQYYRECELNMREKF